MVFDDEADGPLESASSGFLTFSEAVGVSSLHVAAAGEVCTRLKNVLLLRGLEVMSSAAGLSGAADPACRLHRLHLRC